MSCFSFLYGSKSSKTSNTSKTNAYRILKTTLGYSGSNGPFYYIKNADIVSDAFETIKFIVKDENKIIKFTRCYNVSDLDFEHEHPELEIKAHPTTYPNMCFYISEELIYEHTHHIIVDVEITVSKDSKVTDIEQILDIDQDQYCDK
jgi:hypothetical protein